jgi:hypothetical protein
VFAGVVTRRRHMDMDSVQIKRELERLILEAAQIAPSIANLGQNPNYGNVTDEKLDRVASVTWELEADSVINTLAASGHTAFKNLRSRYFTLKGETFHSRSIFVHQAAELLATALKLLDSPVTQLVEPTAVKDYPQAKELEPPEKITFPWLLKHVSVRTWWAGVAIAGSLLIGGFVVGIKASEMSFVRGIFGLGKTPEVPIAARTPTLPVPSTPAPPLPPREEERAFVSVTPEYLTNFYRQHTSTQADTLAEPYIGRWMKVSGTVSDVSKLTKAYALVRFERPDPHPEGFVDIRTYFRGETLVDRVSLLPRGQHVVVVGQIKGVSQVTLDLDNCDVIEPPLRK